MLLGQVIGPFSRVEYDCIKISLYLGNVSGLPKKKRNREDDQQLETPDLKKRKTKPGTPHSFPKVKRVSNEVSYCK